MVFAMQEPYKEMYMHLRRNLDMLERVFKRLSVRVSDALIENNDIYLTYLNEQMVDKEEFKQQFAELVDGQ